MRSLPSVPLSSAQPALAHQLMHAVAVLVFTEFSLAPVAGFLFAADFPPLNAFVETSPSEHFPQLCSASSLMFFLHRLPEVAEVAV